MEKHVPIVGWLNIGYGVLTVFTALLVLVTLVGIGVAVSEEDPEARTVLIIVGTTVSSFLCLLALPHIIGGIWLLKREPWARIVVLIVGFLSLINIPLGTALGIYTIWVLIQDETAQLFTTERGS